MKFIEITMSKGNSFTLPYPKAQKLLESEQQIILVHDDKGNWTGESINKAHIISTRREHQVEREWRRDNQTKLPKKDEPEIMPEVQAKMDKIRDEIKGKFSVNK